ncbi:hypothetical protein [Micromonospora sp. WMMD1082]|uniref:hypothetical protein n=1 Tax=Micromonospora sp. WMMD1082 TaxID=3016104 RepID=UPI002417122D|nr:hypothetical protein [Micromonospora sp. WMMD1082]MDG4797384.1 hypothetical protein [Micromonospora sp. WMMD1082]
MQVSQALDLIETLLRAAEHPDIVSVARYGRDNQPGGQSPAGVKAVHQSGTAAMLWAAEAPRDATPVPLPTEPIPPKWRAARILVLAHQLLDVARPDQLLRWELCGQAGADVPVAAALRLTARDGSMIYLRGTAASGGSVEPETDRHPDYQIPPGVRSCLQAASAPSAERVSA